MTFMFECILFYMMTDEVQAMTLINMTGWFGIAQDKEKN